MATDTREDRLDCCELTSAVEDYLKAIYHLSVEQDPVTTSAIADRVQVAPPSVSAMLRRLRGSSLVSDDAGRTVALTDHGRRHALRIIRRHRLLETFLAEVLDVPWDEVHVEAERLEHALSDPLEERIARKLGHPTHDPHGDPIPPRDGGHDESWPEPLDAVPAGMRFRVERVSDRDSEALRYLADLGVRPGAVLAVGERAPFGGPLWVDLRGRSQALGIPLARLVHGRVLAAGDTESASEH
ncbi:MAG: metal-dependent transcriptional regulator [Egibacteraceae bacterium]